MGPDFVQVHHCGRDQGQLPEHHPDPGERLGRLQGRPRRLRQAVQGARLRQRREEERQQDAEPL